MSRYSYETVEVEASLWTSEPKGLETTLNEYAARGWRLAHILPPNSGGLSKYILIFERAVA
ncbi:MAG: DUF4177 domain-containing protein [Candidatus Delongbacteria bacterium]